MLDRLRTAWGIGRSLWIYYGDRRRAAAMDALYATFLRPGDFAFDIGAHVGDRTASFRRLGARVVAVEPQAALVTVLRLIYRRDAGVAIVPAAVGRAEGSTRLMINRVNPTVSTASHRLVEAAHDAAGWEGQVWSHAVDVPMTTLDALIARHGVPAFIKIDVEGFEAEALAGLSRPSKALSFEFTTVQRNVALASLERCATLGYRRFNAALGESQSLVHADWIDAAAIGRWLMELPHAANSGDIYAALQ
jgi:FkbM family methyltransferase